MILVLVETAVSYLYKIGFWISRYKSSKTFFVKYRIYFYHRQFFCSQVGWKAVLDRYDIKYINEKRLKLIEAKIFKYNRTTKAVTAEIEILYDITPLVMVTTTCIQYY